MVKYRVKLLIYKLCATLVTLTSLLLLLARKPSGRHCYAILTSGERLKYVYMIANQLKAQNAVSTPKDILIFHDGSFPVSYDFIFQNGYTYSFFTEHDDLTVLYIAFFQWVFVTQRCDSAVFLEDDIFIGEDAVEYFNWGREVMRLDHSVLSVSGSHDNAERHFQLNANVFVKAEQFLGLGWLTNKRFYDKYLGRIRHVPVPWDKQLNDMMNRDGLISIFPHLPRTVHMPWSKCRNGDLVTLQLSLTNNNRRGWPTPHEFTANDPVKWLQENIDGDVVEVEGFNEKEVKVKWPFSFLAKRPFGKYGKNAIYPMENGDVLVVHI